MSIGDKVVVPKDPIDKPDSTPLFLGRFLFRTAHSPSPHLNGVYQAHRPNGKFQTARTTSPAVLNCRGFRPANSDVSAWTADKWQDLVRHAAQPLSVRVATLVLERARSVGTFCDTFFDMY